jgi:hypothetical protein
MSVGKESYLTIKLDHDDWDYDKGGWEFPVLSKLDAEITSVKLNRKLLNSNRYNLNESGDVIRVTNDYNDELWEPETAKLSVTIKFTKGLSTQEETDKWKLFSIILGPIATLLAAIIAFNKPTTTVTAIPTATPTVTVTATPTVTVTATPTVTVTATPTVTVTAIPATVNPFKKDYENGLYPRSDCGLVEQGKPIYPIFVPNDGNNFAKVYNNFCRDAKRLEDKILIASFSDEKKANMFLEFIGEYFNGVRKGKKEE